jgi:hypothetical protein
MKKLFFFFLLFAVNNSFAQYSTMFNDTLNPFGPGGSDLRDIVQDDSFYYALGGVNNYEPQWSNMIIKLDRNFQIVNKRKYIDTTWLYANYPYNTMVVPFGDGDKEDYDKKVEIQKLVFLNEIKYNRKKEVYRTEKINSIFLLNLSYSGRYKDKKESGKLIINENSALVPLTRTKANFLIEDLGFIERYGTKF